MDISSIVANFSSVKEKSLTNRFFKHKDIVALLEKLPTSFKVETLGYSVMGKSIHAVKWGKGQTKVMLWSQMHGDEATGTMALFDIFNYLQLKNETVEQLMANCQFYFLPMVNPDGAAVFTRRNAQQIDLNRDFLNTVTPEAKILKEARANFCPEFGFNLHDQTTLWSVDQSLKPATLSFLAPAFDKELSVNITRENAMLVIAEMFAALTPVLPNQIGLFDDEHEPRAFGDNFQKAGTATILIEAGGYADDYEKQEIRQHYFAAILAGLVAIGSKSYKNQQTDNYHAIPKNNKQIFHLLIHNVNLAGIVVSVGINYDEYPSDDGFSTFKIFNIQDIGDLSFCDAYQSYDAKHGHLKGSIELDAVANFELRQENEIILAFKNGELLQKH